jgi:polysaccharide export outer membrane protein
MLMAAGTLLSCTTNKENTLSYFKDLTAVAGSLPNPQSSYPIRLQPDDELVITVTSLVPEATEAYNLPLSNPAKRGALNQTTQPRLQTFIVDDQGYIMMPMLGRILVLDKTTTEVARDITAMISQDVKDPHVRVDLVNFSVDVLGEVKAPQRTYSGREQFTVLDAIAQCGDLTEFAKRDRVFVIRTENGKRTYNRLDLNNSDIFNSEYFYLRQNDVIYVEPNEIRIDNSKYNQNNAFKLSVISTIVSSASVVASLVIALATRK